MSAQWYSFNGGNPATASNYSPQGSTAPTCSLPTEQLCAIFTETATGNKPVLDLNIALEMANALQNQVNTTNVKLKER
jgi:hypothetical protein